MQCTCGNLLRWKAFQEKAGLNFKAGIMPCMQCGIKHIVSNINDEEGVNIVYNCDKNTWKYEEIKELDTYTKHSCNDFCFYKGKKIYTYWIKGSKHITICKSFKELIDRFTL